MLPDYAELHCLSNFSFLRGASHPDELVEQAVAQGYAALALTDECSLAGIVRAHQAARQAGLKLLVGSEMTTLDGLKLVFIAQNREGYGNLSALITLARRRADKGHYTLHRHDLNAVSPNGALPDCLVLWVPGEGQGADEGRWLAERFPGRLWIAVELHAGADDTARLAGLCHLSVPQFHARFVELVGVAPQAWLRGLRLDAAMAQLAQGQLLETTALRCGYRTASALAYALRRERGVTSRQLREQR